MDWEEARGVPSFQGCQVVLFLDTLHSKVRNWSSVQGKELRLRAHTHLKNTHWHTKKELFSLEDVELVDGRVK